MLKVEEMTFSYKRNEYLLNRLNFDITPGGVYGLLGKNGSGKSTLLYLMTGLMFPKIGHIYIDGVEPRKRLPDTLSQLYLLPEEYDVPATSVDEFVKRNAVFYPRFSRESRIGKLLIHVTSVTFKRIHSAPPFDMICHSLIIL